MRSLLMSRGVLCCAAILCCCSRRARRAVFLMCLWPPEAIDHKVQCPESASVLDKRYIDAVCSCCSVVVRQCVCQLPVTQMVMRRPAR